MGGRDTIQIGAEAPFDIVEVTNRIDRPLREDHDLRPFRVGPSGARQDPATGKAVQAPERCLKSFCHPPPRARMSWIEAESLRPAS